MTISTGLSFSISGGGKRIIAVIEAYIDEAGTHTNTPLAPFLCVACYFASAIRWRDFENDWELTLKEYDVEYFHARNRSHDIIRPFLANIIENCKLRGVVTFVTRKTYDAHASAQTKSVLGDAYAACVSNCVIKVCRLTKTLYPGKSVVFFIEAGQSKAKHIESKLKSMIGKSFDKDCAPIAGVALVEKKQYMPLQTADFLSHVCSAWESNWIDRLASHGLLWFSPMGRGALKQAGGDIKTMFSTIKWMRKLGKSKTNEISSLEV